MIALFPEISADIYGTFCEAYEHIGQHGVADYWGVIQATTPVQPEDAADLAEELTRIGYRQQLAEEMETAERAQLARLQRKYA